MKIILCSEVDDVFIPKDRVFTTEKCLSNSYKHMHPYVPPNINPRRVAEIHRNSRFA